MKVVKIKSMLAVAEIGLCTIGAVGVSALNWQNEVASVQNDVSMANTLKASIMINGGKIESTSYLNSVDNTVTDTMQSSSFMERFCSASTIIDKLWLSDIDYVSKNGNREQYRINSIEDEPVFDGNLTVYYYADSTVLQYEVQTFDGTIHRKVRIDKNDKEIY